MQQVFSTIDPNTTSGTDLSNFLNQFKDSVLSLHSGTSPPTYAKSGTIWADTSNSFSGSIRVYVRNMDASTSGANTDTLLFSYMYGYPIFLPSLNSMVLQSATSTAQNVYTIDTQYTNGSIVSYFEGLTLQVSFDTDNTGPVTLDINGLGSTPIKTQSGKDLIGGEIKATGIYTLVYNSSSYFVLIDGSYIENKLTTVPSAGSIPLLNSSGDIDSTISIDSFQSANWDFISADLSIPSTTASSVITQAHGLPNTPKISKVYIKCISPDKGHDIGDEIDVTQMVISNTSGITVSSDNTNIYLGTYNMPGFWFISKTGDTSVINTTNWVFVLKANK